MLILLIFVCTVKAYFRIESGESGGLLAPAMMLLLVFPGIPDRKAGPNLKGLGWIFLLGFGPVLVLELLHQDRARFAFLDLLFVAGCANLLFVTYLTFTPAKPNLAATEITPDK
ncbi:MAG: hypothetical protein K8R88_07625 [Armatimonadetes bacterium]|nr:hypothetical protein [Armatimonadota bacterium]